MGHREDVINSVPPHNAPAPGSDAEATMLAAGTGGEHVHASYEVQYLVMYHGKPLTTLKPGTPEEFAVRYLAALNARLARALVKQLRGKVRDDQLMNSELAILVELPCLDPTGLDLPPLDERLMAAARKLIVPNGKRVARPDNPGEGDGGDAPPKIVTP